MIFNISDISDISDSGFPFSRDSLANKRKYISKHKYNNYVKLYKFIDNK